MIKIIILADSYKHFEKAILEYEKRLGKQIEVVKLKPVKNWNIIEKETDSIIKYLEKQNAYKIVLNPKGKNLSTKEFYDFIEKKKQTTKNIVFIIGGALWLDYEKLKNNIDYELNLWKMTMPHSLALLVLLEQIYRLEMIKKGTSYDK